MKDLKPKIKRLNLKIALSTHQLLMNEKAKTYKSINLLVEEAIIKNYGNL
jgi:predicted HicB family RNase H-like nuclease